MCGIAGFTHWGRRSAPGTIRRATLTLDHRGPDQNGCFESSDVSLGAVRLKIIDLESGDQPIQTEDGNFVIVFNGEIYNHAEIRAELEGLGHCFHSHCDTEVALRAFAQWDVECFSRLRGMFALALWDAAGRRLVLVRDRLGIKPLYYAIRHGNIYFGSELKAIFAHDEIPRNLCHKALGYYLSLNYIPGPLTLIEGIEKLDPGTWLECRNGRFTTGRYWQNRFAPEAMGTEEACEELDGLLSQSVREHLISDVPVGIWASGGLDSSIALHYAAQHSSRQLQTFSISFHGRTCDESKYFRLLSERYGTRHHELDLSADLDLSEAIHEIAYYSDEPSADAGALPVWYLARLTAQQVKATLSGEGADEIFGGYQTYLADRYSALARRAPAFLLRMAAKCMNLLPVSDEKIGLEYKLKRFLAGSLLPSDEAHFFWNGTFSRETRPRLAIENDSEPLSSVPAQLSGLPSRSDVVNRYLFIDQHYYLPDDILYKCDRMSMAHALEVRPPFLDHRIVEFAGRLPSDLKIRGRKTKYILRELMRRKLPKAILNRRKEGLDIPAHEWLRGPLRTLLLDALSPASIRRAGIFAPDPMQALIGQHLDRKANLGYHLWGLLTLHLWMQRWKVQTQFETVQEPNPAFASLAG